MEANPNPSSNPQQELSEMQQNDPKAGGAPVKTQEEIDEMRKQIALSNEYEN